eukprot:Phypoly_transcript_04743.p1 GENE.Phypoly_transcript_04743~~Phypoly_transcript_04743.p1  ORF type:complete len:617 (+),score=51.21 Phypoly_transcript_04743:168-2018(+)
MTTIFLLLLSLFPYVILAANTNTTQCLSDIGELLQDKYVSPTISATMILSTGLVPGQYGNYDQCQEIGKQISQYCFLEGSFEGNTVTMGVCAPASCSETDLVTFSSKILSKFNMSTSLVYCNNQHDDPSLGAGGTVCLVVVGLLVLVVLIGTLFTYLQQEKAFFKASINDETDVALLTEEQRVREAESPFWMELFICFSIPNNLSFLLHDKSSSGSLGMLNGLRVLMMFWVILGHTLFFQVITTGYDNTEHLLNLLNNSWGFQFIFSAEYAVDVFFFLSAFLVVYLTYRQMKSNKPVPWVYYYAHRYWRLTPVYMLLIFIYFKVIPALGRGPIWFMYKGSSVPACDKYWWTNMLYINNLHPWTYGDGCFGWSWYLANDMQFFCIVPVILLGHKYSKKIGWTIITLLVVVCMIMNGWLMDKNYATGSAGQANAIYQRPYTRMGPYVIGIAAAFFVLDFPRALANSIRNTATRWASYIFSFGLVLVCTYATYHQDSWNKTDYIAFTMFSRDAYTFGIAIFCLICVGGYGGIPKWVLSAAFWAPLAKLTYCAYLVHPIIMEFFMFQQTTNEHWTWSAFSRNFLGYLCLSYAVALVFHLLVEKPCSNLERLVLKKNGIRQ